MSFNSIKTKAQSERGFTIVELLIVIVVIGILAAITIVAYNGVTARANTTSAQGAASSLSKKIEAYNAEKSGYPATFSLLTATADSGNSYYVPSNAYTLATAAIAAKPTTTNTSLSIQSCAGTTGPILGMIVGYWDYTANVQKTVPSGTITGTGITCTYIAS